MRLVYTIEIDEAKLDESTRALYEGEEYDDPVVGEPRPGYHLLEGFVAEARYAIAQGHGEDVDTIFWGDSCVTRVSVELHDETGGEDG